MPTFTILFYIHCFDCWGESRSNLSVRDLLGFKILRMWTALNVCIMWHLNPLKCKTEYCFKVLSTFKKPIYNQWNGQSFLIILSLHKAHQKIRIRGFIFQMIPIYWCINIHWNGHLHTCNSIPNVLLFSLLVHHTCICISWSFENTNSRAIRIFKMRA